MAADTSTDPRSILEFWFGDAAADPARAQAREEVWFRSSAEMDAEIRQRFEAGASGTETVRGLSFLMDQLIRALYDFVGSHVYPLANPTSGEHMAVVAVGGYGRGELAPYSDIDLLFLLPYKSTPHTEQVVEYMLYVLWDLGLKVVGISVPQGFVHPDGTVHP